MRVALFVLAVMAVGLPVTSFAADDAALPPAVTACLRDNAAKVESTEPDLTKATDYLVGYVCALPIAQEQQRETQARSQALADRTEQQCEQRVATQKQQNPAARVTENCSQLRDNFIGFAGLQPLISAINVAKPAAAVSLAAKLMLDLRLAHAGQKGK